MNRRNFLVAALLLVPGARVLTEALPKRESTIEELIARIVRIQGKISRTDHGLPYRPYSKFRTQFHPGDGTAWIRNITYEGIGPA